MPSERRIRVNFDAKTYPYRVELGKRSSGGNTGRCIDGGFGNSTQARIRVKLPQVSSVSFVSLDWWKQHPNHLNIQTVFQFYQADGSLITNLIDTLFTPVQSWATSSYSGLSIQNVKFVVFWVGASLANNLLARMDNCVVRYTYMSVIAPSNTGDQNCGGGLIAGDKVGGRV